MGELRWILLGLGTVAIGAIWWWSTRRSAQAPGHAELRESSVLTPPAPKPAPAESLPADKRDYSSAPRTRLSESSHAGESGDRGISPLEPLSIRTLDLEPVPPLDEPMMPHADLIEVTLDLSADSLAASPGHPDSREHASPLAAPAPASVTAPVAPPAPAITPTAATTASNSVRLRPSTETSDRFSATITQEPNSSEAQRILAVRVCAVGDSRWSGAELMAKLELHGLAHGRYQVYHRKHTDGRSIFCVASLVEPGTFDVTRMAQEEFRGVSLFAVLPGPLEPLQTVDALLTTARDLARELTGTVQDASGIPFSPQRVAQLREEVARFQATLP